MTKLRSPRRTRLVLAAAVVLAGLIAAAILSGSSSGGRSGGGLATNPNLDPGTPLSRPAPDFTLRDESDRPVSLHSFRNRVVILAFNDSQCTTVCPLTTTAMVEAKRRLGAAADRVQLLGIDANPEAISIRDVRAYSEVHGMVHAWRFLTGSLRQLREVWRAYAIGVQIERGQIDHTPALFVIDPAGRLAKLYMTQLSYASVDQLGQLLAQEASGLLPDHPPVSATLSYDQIPPIAPSDAVVLPRAGGGTLRLGSSGSPRLLLFFATWDSQVTDLSAQLQALGKYQSGRAAARLPALSAVDEGSVEPSPGALPRFLHALPGPLPYAVAVDQSGRVADGYGVQDEPWFVLTSGTGRVLWYYDVSSTGWLTAAALAKDVHSALARAPAGPPSATAAQGELAGSPAALAALHAQAGQLLGSESALSTRVRALRSYPVVVNAWASWCGPCRAEFGLFASASARFGRQVAFLGADAADSSGSARSFLAAHPVSYPSYQSTIPALGSLAVVAGLPTTIFINRAGKVVYVHTGQYDAQGTLDQDIVSHALAGKGA